MAGDALPWGMALFALVRVKVLSDAAEYISMTRVMQRDFPFAGFATGRAAGPIRKRRSFFS